MKLLPCPFCGGHPELSGMAFFVYCIECGAEGARFASDEAAANGWNKRHHEANPSLKISDQLARYDMNCYEGDDFVNPEASPHGSWVRFDDVVQAERLYVHATDKEK